MLTVLIAIAGFLLAMLPLVVVHEWGHYWMAKKLGVKILRFSIGFGKPLWMRRFGRDQTEWVIAAIPFGGYVKMVDEAEGNVDVADLPRAFNRQALWKRTLIVLAGPMANLLLAFGLYSGMLMYGVQQMKPEISAVKADSMAGKAGFAAGQTIRAINDRKVESWSDVDLDLLLQALGRERATVLVQTADGSERRLTLDFSGYDRGSLNQHLTRDLGFGLFPYGSEAVIGHLAPNLPGQRAGLRAGDRVVAIDGRAVAGWDDMAEMISAHPAQPVTLQVLRGTQLMLIKVTPQSSEIGGKRVGRLGIGPVFDERRMQALLFKQQFGPWDSAVRTWEQGASMTRLTLEMMGRMLLGQVSTKNLSGPIGIASMAGETIQAGIPFFVSFLCVMSLSLGLLNLLPIPVLDGGHLVYYLAEAIRGRPLSDRTLSMGQRLGVVLLGLLTLLAFYNDLHRLLPSH